MRKEVPEIGWGDFQLLPTGDPAVLAMRYDWRNNSVVFVHNLVDTPREVTFDVGLPGEAGRAAGQPAVRGSQPSRTRRAARLMLEAYGYRWYRVGGLDYLLKRSDVETPAPRRRPSRRSRRSSG